MADSYDVGDFWVVEMGMKDIIVNRKQHRFMTKMVIKRSKVAKFGALNVHVKAFTWAPEGNDIIFNEMFDRKFYAEPYFREIYDQHSELH